MKYQHYIVIETKEDRISLFNLYDDETKTIYEGESQIKDVKREIKSNLNDYFVDHLILIPIKKAQFEQMLNFSYMEKIHNKLYKKFIKDHNLIEWSI